MQCPVIDLWGMRERVRELRELRETVRVMGEWETFAIIATLHTPDQIDILRLVDEVADLSEGLAGQARILAEQIREVRRSTAPQERR